LSFPAAGRDLALAAGISAFLGVDVPIVAIGLILVGLGLLVRELGARRAQR